jgi:hypothetical protein
VQPKLTEVRSFYDFKNVAFQCVLNDVCCVCDVRHDDDYDYDNDNDDDDGCGGDDVRIEIWLHITKYVYEPAKGSLLWYL